MENAGAAVCFGAARPVTMISLALTSQNGGPCLGYWMGRFTPHSFSHILVIAKRFSKIKRNICILAVNTNIECLLGRRPACLGVWLMLDREIQHPFGLPENLSEELTSHGHAGSYAEISAPCLF